MMKLINLLLVLLCFPFVFAKVLFQSRSKKKKSDKVIASAQLKYLTGQQVNNLYIQALQQVESRILSIHINRQVNPKEFDPALLQEALDDLRRLEMDYHAVIQSYVRGTDARLKGQVKGETRAPTEKGEG